jgi:hypothetical protein
MLAPQTLEGKKEIVECLLRNCQSEEHAVTVMTRVLDGALRVEGPITAWIASVARQTQTYDRAPAGCDLCYLGPDVTTGEVRWAEHVSVQIGGYDCARRCTCDRGGWLAAKDLERGAAKPAARARHEHPADADWRKRAAGDQ